MRHDESQQLEAAGQDSFLDITTNIVGILIILVMVVGMRVQHGPKQSAKEQAAAKAKLESLEHDAAAVEYDARRMQEQLESIEAETDARSHEREQLATLMVAAEKELADRRSQLDAASQEEYDLKRQLDEAKRDLDRGQKEFADLDAQKPPTQQVNHYPTPLSRTVLGKEIHFQLKDGRLTFLPMEEFLDEIRQKTQNTIDRSKFAGVVGPRNGFELRFELEPVFDGHGRMTAAGCAGTLVPVGIPHGESISEAISSRSEFRSVLARNSPSDTTVTLWTYPNSFSEYRQLKEVLYQLGYATAGRPMPNGALIKFSSQGTRSAAQ